MLGGTTQHREAISATSRLLWDRGWVANHDGNITVRLDDGRLLATPTAVSKRLIGVPFRAANLGYICRPGG